MEVAAPLAMLDPCPGLLFSPPFQPRRPGVTAMRLLLVEDDHMIGEAVQELLRAESHAVDWVPDGNQADAALLAQRYDLVLLDLGLPGRDGLQVLRALRARHDRTPVLITTARDAVAQRVQGLDAGADDYLLKPYDLDELLARIRALARRAGGQSDEAYACGEVWLNPVTREQVLAEQREAAAAAEEKAKQEKAAAAAKAASGNLKTSQRSGGGTASKGRTMDETLQETYRQLTAKN